MGDEPWRQRQHQRNQLDRPSSLRRETALQRRGLSEPYGIAIDGAGNVWTANNGGNSNSISEFNASGKPISGTNGYVSNGLLEPYGIAVDGSGNVWVASDDAAAR